MAVRLDIRHVLACLAAEMLGSRRSLSALVLLEAYGERHRREGVVRVALDSLPPVPARRHGVEVLVGARVEVPVGSATVADGVMFDPTVGSLAVGLAALLVSSVGRIGARVAASGVPARVQLSNVTTPINGTIQVRFTDILL